MSSWKQYGGTNKGEKANDINADSIITNNLSLKKPYQGNLIINGGLQINKNLLISGSTQMVGNTVFDNIIVNGLSRFEGIATLNSTFEIEGNIDSKSNVNVENNINCGNILYFNNNSQFIYGNTSGIGINKVNPNAALDISTNLVNGIIVKSSQPDSTSTLIQNVSGQGILLYGNTIVEYIDFFNETNLNSGSKGDARLSYTKGGIFELDVSQNINLMSNITVSNRGSQPHIFNETMIIYDTSNGPFYGNIYSQPITNGSALTLVSSDNISNTFLHITTPSGEGLAIGGGVYSDDTTRSYAFIGLTDSSQNMINSGIIVSGSDPVKYRSTIGINAFQPKTEKYILDINGPVHIDNGDITLIQQSIPFQIYSMSISNIQRNKIIALGSSYDISIQSGFSNYRERIIISNDYGSTWSQIDISNGLLNLKADKFTNIYTYDNSYAFITGTKNTLFFSIDGGYNWNNVVTGLPNNTFNNIQIGNSNIVGNHILYFSAESRLYYYDFSFNTLNLETESITVSSIITPLININAITTNTTSIFLAGSKIIKYNTNNLSIIDNSYNNSSTISYKAIDSYNNTIIAVGDGIISSSRNNGLVWTDVSLNIQFNSIFCNDVSNAIAVGNNGNIWITQNGGISWTFLPDSILNPSGKKWIVTDPSNLLQNVVMSDSNTILIANTIKPYIQGSQAGSSELINIFIPKFLNRSNNNLLDICGNMMISGDIRINDGGSLQSTNNTFSIFDASVQNITVGNATKSIILGGLTTGTTELRHNVTINGNSILKKNLSVLYDSSLNGNLSVSGNSNFKSDVSMNGNLIIDRNMMVYGNIIGLYDTELNGNLSVSGYSNIHSDISIGGNATIHKNLSVIEHSNFKSDVSMNGNLIIDRNMMVYGNIIGLNDISLNGNLFVKNTTINGNLTVLSNINITGNLEMSHDSTLIATHILPNTDGILTIGDKYDSTSTQIYVGGPHDNIIFQGQVVYELPAINNAPFVVVNANASGYATSGGCGINIYDNSGEPTPYDPLTDAGYMHIGYDLQSFVFKAPNINQDGNQISGNNIIRLGVNSLTLQNPNIINGLVVLQKDRTYHDIQEANGTSFGGYRPDEANYAIVSANLDISNIMLKQIDSITGSQVLETNLIIGNAIMNNNLSVYGNLDINGTSNFVSDSSFNGNLSLGKNLVINGTSTFISDSSFNSNLQVRNNLTIQGNVIGLYDSSLNGNLNVGKNMIINGSSNVISDSSFNANVVIGRNLTIRGNLVGLYDNSLNGNLTVGKNMVINGTSTFISDSSFNANLQVRNNLTIQGNVIGLYDSSLNGNLTVGKNLVINGTSNFISDSSFNANLQVRNNLTIQGNIIGLYDLSLNGNLTLGKNMVINGTSNVISDSSFNANVVVGRNVTIRGNVIGLFDNSLNGNLTVGKNMVINGTSTFISDSSFNSNLQVRNNVIIQGNVIGLYDSSLNGNLTVGKNMVVNGSSNFISDSSFNSNLQVRNNVIIQGNVIGLYDSSLNGNLVLGKNMVVNGSSNVMLDSSFNANLVVRNNLNIQGNVIGLYDLSLNGNLVLGKNMVINGTSNVISDSSFNANLVVGRNLTIRGNINALYDLSLNGNLRVGRNMVVNGNSTFISDSSFNGNINIGGNINIYSTANSINSTTGALIVNGGCGFGGDVNINGNIFAKNLGGGSSNSNVIYWNSQSLGITSFPTNTYYLLATMGDFSNNYGSININGTIGSTSFDIIYINAIITREYSNISNPKIIGTISNNVPSLTCDIVIYYDNSSNNYQPVTPSITTINGFIYDTSTIFYNTSNSLIDNNVMLSGEGISNNPIISKFNTTHFSINTIPSIGNLTPYNSYTSSVGFCLNQNQICIQNKSIPTGTFLTSTSINNYSKPFISINANNGNYSTPNNIFTTSSNTEIFGFIQNISAVSYLITNTGTEIRNKLLYSSINSYTINDAPVITNNNSVSTKLYTLSSNQIDSSYSEFYGYRNSNSIHSNTPNLSSGNFISDTTGSVAYGTTISNVAGRSATISDTIANLNSSTLSGAIYTSSTGSISYFVYRSIDIDPGINSFITSTSAPIINNSDCVFLSNKGSGNNYSLTFNTRPPNTASRFSTNGGSIPYYILSSSTIAIPLGLTFASAISAGDILTFNNTTTGGVVDGILVNNVITSGTSYHITTNVSNLTNTAVARTYTFLRTGTINHAANSTIPIGLNVSGQPTAAIGQFVSITGSGAGITPSQYPLSSIRITSVTIGANNTSVTLDTAITLNGSTTAGGITYSFAVYVPTPQLNILPATTFTDQQARLLRQYQSNTYNTYNPITFNFYSPKIISLNNIIDVSDGIGPSPQYQVFLRTNSNNGGNPNTYFNLAITSDMSDSTIYLPTDTSYNPIEGSNLIVPSICESLIASNNVFDKEFGFIATIDVNSIVNYSNTTVTPSTVGIDINIIYGNSFGIVRINNPFITGGSTLQIDITCFTNYSQNYTNNYFTIGYPDDNIILYTSPPLTLAPTKYRATVIVPIEQINNNIYITTNFSSPSNQNIFTIDEINCLRLDTFTNSFVGIGKTSPKCPLDIQGNSGTLLKLTNNTTAYTQGETSIEFWKNQSNYNLGKISAFDTAISPNAYKSNLTLYAANNNVFVPGIIINTLGEIAASVGINTVTPNVLWTLFVEGSVRATDSVYFEQDVDALSYNARSDYRLKENIIPISDTDFSIDQLKPVYYNFKESQKKDLGFLAHEVQSEIPFLVTGEKDGEDMQSINYNGFIALLVKEIQDLKSEMKILKEEVNELRNRV